MITEVRPGTFQTTLPNGVIWSFTAPSMATAQHMLKDQLDRIEKRQGKSLARKTWGGRQA